MTSPRMASTPAASTPGWAARLLRRIGCDRNPLRRTADRIETWAVLLIIVGYVPLAMLAAGYAGHLVREAGLRAQRGPQPRQAAAVVLATAQPARPVAAAAVSARWTAGGRTRTGTVPAGYGTQRGAVIRVWVDRNGHLARPPLTAAELHAQIRTAEVTTPILLAELLALSVCALRYYLNRRRLASWDFYWRSANQFRAP